LSITNCLIGIAGVLTTLGQPQRAARLFGAAEALRDTTGAKIQPGDQPDYEKNLASTLTQLEAETFEAAWQDGRGMSLEQAITSALKLTTPTG
jgi:hypothetical protein